jgi:hypothetical protein
MYSWISQRIGIILIQIGNAGSDTRQAAWTITLDPFTLLNSQPEATVRTPGHVCTLSLGATALPSASNNLTNVMSKIDAQGLNLRQGTRFIGNRFQVLTT